MTEERRGRSESGDMPAYPCDYSRVRPHINGMSKREHYASLLLAGMNANPYYDEMCNAAMIDVAMDQVRQLLEALEKCDREDT